MDWCHTLRFVSIQRCIRKTKQHLQVSKGEFSSLLADKLKKSQSKSEIEIEMYAEKEWNFEKYSFEIIFSFF